MEIVTLDELKTHLRIEHGEEDDYLAMLLLVAKASAEDFCRTDFPDDEGNTPEPVRLALLLHTSFYYANREGSDGASFRAMMQAFQALLWPYRIEGKLF